MSSRRMTREVVETLSLAEQHESLRQPCSRRTAWRGGIVGELRPCSGSCTEVDDFTFSR
jgi:hypothetical protein